MDQARDTMQSPWAAVPTHQAYLTLGQHCPRSISPVSAKPNDQEFATLILLIVLNRAKVDPLVTGFSGARYRSCITLEEAKAYMKAYGITKYQVVLNAREEEMKNLTGDFPSSQGRKYYAMPEEWQQPSNVHMNWE